jgi:hypothetical protein
MSIFDEFYAKLNDIVNSSTNLGETMEESKVVRKILRSLPKRLNPKVTAIEDAKDISAIKVIQLVRSLHAYKTTTPRNSKGKSMARKTVKKEESESSYYEYRVDYIAFLAKKFKSFFKKNIGNLCKDNSFVHSDQGKRYSKNKIKTTSSPKPTQNKEKLGQCNVLKLKFF